MGDVAKYMQDCAKCRKIKPLPYVTLYYTQMLPCWSEHLVQYLTKREVDAKNPNHHKITLEIDARDYTMIGQQLYKWGKDGNL